jgi:hypothetical protein
MSPTEKEERDVSRDVIEQVMRAQGKWFSVGLNQKQAF